MGLGKFYIPIPMWDNKKGWQPIDFAKGHTLSEWPEGIELDRLPKPPFKVGEVIRFEWDKYSTPYMQGPITEIQLAGGTCDNIKEAMEERYYDPKKLQFTANANGHSRWVRLEKITINYPEKEQWFKKKDW